MASPWQSPGGITSPWGTMVAGPEGKLRSFLEADGVLQDVEVAGRAVSEALERDVQASGLDLADALDPARVPLNPYSTQPKDVRSSEIFLVPETLLNAINTVAALQSHRFNTLLVMLIWKTSLTVRVLLAPIGLLK